jgi:hypothetical protein
MSQDLLAQLAPPHAPPPPGWWPPAPGWWMLAGAGVLLALAAVGLTLLLRTPSRRQRRAALDGLRRLHGADGAELASGLARLVRRYALARFGRAAVAQLSGDAWLAFVIARGGGAWAGEPGRELLRAAYGGAAATHRALWLRGARDFVRKN